MKRVEGWKWCWLTAGAAGLILAAQGGLAQDTQGGQQSDKPRDTQSQHQQMSQQEQTPEFSELDQDGDGQVQWQEIESEYDQELQQAQWNERQVMEQFDQDNDQNLDEQEYDRFQTALNAQAAGGAVAGDQQQGQQRQGQQQQGPQFSELDTDEDGEVQWQDIESEYDQQLQQAQWDEQQVLQQFDQDNNETLDQNEYDEFQAALNAQATGGAVAQQQPQQQQQQQAQAEPQQIDSAVLNMPVDQIEGATIVNAQGDEVGRVDQIVKNDSSGKLSLVVTSGGILGLGGNDILVDLEEISQMGEDQLMWESELSQEELAEMPEYNETEYSAISGSEFATLEEAQQRG